MARVSPATNERVLVGYGSGDDAGVYLLRDDLALVQTVDFFTPIVDDPYDFGRIAATNALSDVYAMGGTPLSALNIVAFPEDLDLAILARILEGGAAVARIAGVAILGRPHDQGRRAEVRYGRDRRRRSAETSSRMPARRPGDSLVLTKPLGTGVLTTALKRGAIARERLGEAIEAMTTLNDCAALAMLAAGAHSATDITGFGLLGHAENVARASNVRIRIEAARVPFMSGVLDLIAQGVVPGGTLHNAKTHAAFTDFDAGVPESVRMGLSDAQTSGGLLIAVARENLPRLIRELQDRSTRAAVVGEVCEGSGSMFATRSAFRLTLALGSGAWPRHCGASDAPHRNDVVRLRGVGAERHRRDHALAQRVMEDFRQLVDRHERHALAHFLGYVVEIHLVAARQQDLADAGALGAEHFLFEPADRQHLTGERDLAGHREVRIDLDAGEHRGDRGRQRDARRRSVLRRRAGRNVNVQVVLGEVIVGQAQFAPNASAGTRPRPARSPSSRRRAGR